MEWCVWPVPSVGLWLYCIDFTGGEKIECSLSSHGKTNINDTLILHTSIRITVISCFVLLCHSSSHRGLLDPAWTHTVLTADILTCKTQVELMGLIVAAFSLDVAVPGPRYCALA